MIIHIMSDSIYTRRYIEFLANNEDSGAHVFFISGNNFDVSSLECQHIYHLNAGRSLKKLLFFARKANSIILHQLNQPRVLLFLLLYKPRNIHKMCWIIWGGDLAFLLHGNTSFKSKIISGLYEWVVVRLPLIVSHIPGDYELLSEKFPIRAKYLCAKYPGSETQVDLVDRVTACSAKKRIMVGNSGDYSNRHREIFKFLERFRYEDVEVHAVLSYGQSADYIASVVGAGESIFGSKFIPHLEFVPYDEYLALLSTIDVCVFYHDRQQGMGNLNMFFGLGTKVFLSQHVTTYEYYKSLGISVFPTEKIDELSFNDFVLFDESERRDNSRLIATDMDATRIREGWRNVFSFFDSDF